MNKKSLTPLDKRRSANKDTYLTGLSLLEIVVSTLIMALVMVGLVNVFLIAKRYMLSSRSRTAVGELGRYFLDRLQDDVRQDQWGSNCLSSDPTAGCPSAQTVGPILYTPSYAISDLTGTTLRKVKVTITWNEPEP